MSTKQSTATRKPGSPRSTGFTRAEPPQVVDSYRTKALKAYKAQLQTRAENEANAAAAENAGPEDLDLAELLDSGRKAA